MSRAPLRCCPARQPILIRERRVSCPVRHQCFLRAHDVRAVTGWGQCRGDLHRSALGSRTWHVSLPDRRDGRRWHHLRKRRVFTVAARTRPGVTTQRPLAVSASRATLLGAGEPGVTGHQISLRLGTARAQADQADAKPKRFGWQHRHSRDGDHHQAASNTRYAVRLVAPTLPGKPSGAWSSSRPRGDDEAERQKRSMRNSPMS